MNGDGWRPGERGQAGLFAACVLGAVLYPLRQHARSADERVDGFPLSYYPMFSAHRCQHTKILCAIGVRTDGERRFLPYRLLGPGGLNQVRRQLKRVVTEERVREFTDALAVRVAGDHEFSDVVRVQIVRGRFDLDACMLTRRIEPDESTVLATADVPGADLLETDPPAAPVVSEVPA